MSLWVFLWRREIRRGPAPSQRAAGWENLNQVKMRQFPKDICDTSFHGNLPAPLEDARSISVGVKGRLRSSHVTLRHPLLVPALIIVCNHSALIPTLWVPSGPLPSLLFDVRQSRGMGPARLCRGARGLQLWPPVLQGLLACG